MPRTPRHARVRDVTAKIRTFAVRRSADVHAAAQSVRLGCVPRPYSIAIIAFVVAAVGVPAGASALTIREGRARIVRDWKHAGAIEVQANKCRQTSRGVRCHVHALLDEGFGELDGEPLLYWWTDTCWAKGRVRCLFTE